MIDILAAKVVPIDQVAMRLGLDVSKKTIHCLNPNHPDRHPSMGIWVAANKFSCQSCGATYDAVDIVQIVLGVDWHDAYEWVTGDQALKSLTPIRIEPKPNMFTKAPNLTKFLTNYHAMLDQSGDWLAHKGINAGKYGIRKVTWQAEKYIPQWKQHGLFIPYYQNGHITTGRWRNMTTNGDRYYSMPGAQVRLYNQDALAHLDGAKELYLAEGETDTLSLATLGHVALGFPGASNFGLINLQLKPWLASLTGRVPGLVLAFDDDDAGRRLNQKVREALPDIPTRDFDLHGHNDVNDWYLSTL